MNRSTPPDNRPIARSTIAPIKPLAITDGSGAGRGGAAPDFEDKESLIPPPPLLPSLTRDSANPRSEVVRTSTDEPARDNPDLRTTRPNPTNGDEGLSAARRIYQSAVERYSRIDAFECRLTRREFVNNRANPQEVITFRFRKQPYSVYLRWIGAEATGREVVYVDGKFENKIQILPARSDMPLGIRPIRQSYAPADPLVRSSCRHDIREAGIYEQIRQLGTVLSRIDKNPAQRPYLKYLGQVQRPEYPTPLEAVEETIAPRTENLLSQGGKRLTFFDPSSNSPSSHLPVLVITYDNTGREVEYYCFDRFLTPIRLDASDFDADRLWKR